MNEKQISIAIAEACGWYDCGVIDSVCYGLREWQTSLNGHYEALPDYCNDLSAMHEAETTTFGSTDLWQKFVFELLNTCGGSGMSELDGLCCLVQVTARQRAKAFLRTIGKWEEAAK